jgi:hypothetical protein
VWENNFGKKYPDIHGATIAGLSGIVSNKGALVKGCLERHADIAFDGKAHTVVYEHVYGCKTYVGAVRVSPSGVAGSPAFFNFTSANLVDRVSVAFGNTNGLVVFDQFNSPSTYNGPDGYHSIMGLFIDKSK